MGPAKWNETGRYVSEYICKQMIIFACLCFSCSPYKDYFLTLRYFTCLFYSTSKNAKSPQI